MQGKTKRFLFRPLGRHLVLPHLVFLLFLAVSFSEASSHRGCMNFNAGWKFTKTDPAGAEAAAFNDGLWTSIGLPHTYNDGDSYTFVNWAGATWYRKHFTVPSQFSTDRRVYLEFEGVSQQADVWINGTKLGMHKGSSMPFVFDITPQVSFGTAENILAVRVDNSEQACKAVPGAMFWTSDQAGGIVRDVWLHIVDNLHVPLNVYQFQNSWGTYAATLSATQTAAEIAMRTQVKNSSATAKSCKLVTRFVDAQNAVALTIESAQQIAAGATYEFSQSGTVPNPRLWSPESPYLYTIYSIVIDNADTVDVFKTPFGIRTFQFTPTGFHLNGNYLKLRGYGFRQSSYGGFGTAVSNYLHDKDMRLSKEAGANFMREGHSAPDPAIMDACDRYGLFLCHASMCCEVNWSERIKDDPALWLAYKQEFQRDIIVRDRNRPSVLLWEFGNGTITDEQAVTLQDTVKKWDFLNPRPTTVAGNMCECCPGNVVDVYGTQHLNPNDLACNKWPAKAQIGVEYGWDFDVTYRLDWSAQIASAVSHMIGKNGNDGLINYIENEPKWTAVGLWQLYENCGEGISLYGILDANGRIPKVIYEAFKAAWSATPKVKVEGAWAATMTSLPVSVFCSQHIKSVELFTGTQSQGVKTPTSRYISGNNAWQLQVPAPGTPIIAIGKDAAGAAMAFDTMVAYGAAAKIVLTADPPSLVADGGDCSSIIATVCDQNGVWHRTATNGISFSCIGPVNYRGGFNHSGAKNVGSTTLNAEQGKIAVGIRSTNTVGTIAVTAMSTGLASASIQIKSTAPDTGFSAIGDPVFSPGARNIPYRVRAVSLSKGIIRVTYFMPCPGNAVISFFDGKGRMLHRTAGAHSAAGMKENVWNTRGKPLSNGIYLVRVATGSRSDVAVAVRR
jgi:beta-galactosidase